MAKTKSEQKPDGSMSLSGHLRELRNRAVVCLAALGLAFAAFLSLAPRLTTLLTEMGERYGYVYVYIAPQELLMVYISLALTAALAAVFPLIGYHVYAFCGPGLKRGEKIFTLGTLFFGTLCFCVGVLFAYFISVPFMLRFLIRFSTEINVSASISIHEYVSFLLTVFVVFGAIFELPVASVLLTMLGILKAEWMVKARKPMIVVIFLVAAVITPPDVISQIMVAIPMIFLYELSIVLCRVFGGRRGKKDSGDGEEAEPREKSA